MSGSAAQEFRGDVTRGGVLTQTQRVTFEPSPRRLRVTERGSFPERPDVTAACDFVLHPQGYEAIDVRFSAEGMRRDLELTVEPGASEAELRFDGVASRVGIRRQGAFVLFDGPNAMFDYLNCTMLLGLVPGETQRCEVNVVDWADGRLVPHAYTYVRTDREIVVHKSHAPGRPVVLDLDEDGTTLLRVRSGTEETVWSPV